MGGYGSGYSASAPRKPTTNEAIRFDIREYARIGLFANPGETRRVNTEVKRRGTVIARCVVQHEGDHPISVAFLVSFTGDEPRNYRLTLDRTDCHYGGNRPWLMCPFCDRRCAVVWFHGGFIGCRDCLGLAYASTVAGPGEGFIDRAIRLQERLGGAPGQSAWDVPPRPRGMHEATYQRIADAIQDAHLNGIRAALDL